MNKLSYTEVVVRLDEQVKYIKENLDKVTKENFDSHKEIMASINNLCDHVNHEQDKMDKRIRYLEDCNTKVKASWKTLVIIATVSASLTGLIIELIGVLP